MGACSFETVVEGENVKQAFKNAVEQAIWDYGHQPYSGTIKEKSGASEFSVPDVLRGSDNQSVRRLADALWNVVDYNDGGIKPTDDLSDDGKMIVNHLGPTKAKLLVATLTNKWDEACAVKLKDDKYLFLGYASC